jgi:hypothetical protein
MFAAAALSIFDPAVRATLEMRVRTLRCDSPRRWGRMTAHQAVCHMSDVFKMAFGEKHVPPAAAPLGRVRRFVALRVPIKWPRGIRTLPEVEQGCGGTTPTDFERDRSELLALLARFSVSNDAERVSVHPIFGGMTTDEWGIWGYRHVDHHLRQFGA